MATYYNNFQPIGPTSGEGDAPNAYYIDHSGAWRFVNSKTEADIAAVTAAVNAIAIASANASANAAAHAAANGNTTAAVNVKATTNVDPNVNDEFSFEDDDFSDGAVGGTDAAAPNKNKDYGDFETEFISESLSSGCVAAALPPLESAPVVMFYLQPNHELRFAPDFLVIVGDVHFRCPKMLLKHYSKFFANCKPDTEVMSLPMRRVYPEVFHHIHLWLYSKNVELKPWEVPSLYMAAKYLGIRQLATECFKSFNNEWMFSENNAVRTYLCAKCCYADSLCRLMMKRICRQFLPFVASEIFLNLTENEVCSLLRLNSIGVNSEIEIFMSAVRWLSYDWPVRQSSMSELIKCVHFELIAPIVLLLMKQHNTNEIVRYIMDDKDVQVEIGNSIGLLHTMMPDELYVMTKRRCWILDHACVYHHNVTCPMQNIFNYELFTEYMNVLSTMGERYWTTFVFLHHNNGYCQNDGCRAYCPALYVQPLPVSNN